MSAKKEEPKAAPDAKAEPAKKKPPIKLIGMIAGIMIAEAVGVYLVFKAIAPKTHKAEAHEAHVESSDADMVKELKVLEDKFQNMKEGRAWIWDLSVMVQTRKKHSEKVEAIIKGREGEIKQEIGRMVANADHNQLASPDRETLSRQVTAFLVKLIGNDEKTNDPLVDKVLIPRCRGFPAEF